MTKFSVVLMAMLSLSAAAQPGRILVDNTGPSILKFNIDGSNSFAIAANADNNVVFSPSVAGTGRIAFTANTDVDGTYLGHPYIFEMNADGTGVRNISSALPGSSSNCCYDLNPVISPDGTMVAFLATINVAPDGSQPQEIYLVNADGSNLRQLTPFMANPNTNPPIGDYSQSYMDGLAWSPDSSTLAFRGSVYTAQCGTYGGQPIFVSVVGSIKADGTTTQILACDNGDGYVTSIDWSPDGTVLAWGRNVSHGAQGCSGCVGEPAIAFLDFTGNGRYSAGITSAQLTTDSCQGGPHCIHFSPDSTRLAYVDAYPNNGNPCQASCSISFINLDGSSQTNGTIPSGGHTVWWEPGTTLPAPAQLTLAGSAPNVPPNPVEIWPGSPQQLVPTLSDSFGNLIFHSAVSYPIETSGYGHSNCLSTGPYGLAFYSNDFNTGTLAATNAGLTSSAIPYKCWASSPCTFSLGSASTSIPASGGTGMVGVIADPGSTGSTCPWAAIPGASWIAITSGANGSGNGAVDFSVAANTGAARMTTITIAGLTYTVNQDAAGSGVTLHSITVTPNPASVAAGLTEQFMATGNYSDGSTQNLTNSVAWLSSNTGVATINSSGLATGVAAGAPAMISASLNGVVGMAQFTVTAPVLQLISVSPSVALVAAGLTQQFSATGQYSDGSTQTLTSSVTWSSSNGSIATIGSLGLAKGVAMGGPVTITASLNSISGMAQLTVTAPLLVSIAVTPANPSVLAGGIEQFTALGKYTDGSTKNLTGSVTWSSSSTSVATINTSGLASALSNGTTTISAGTGGLSGSTSMTVVTLQSLTIAPLSATIFAGSTLQFTATGYYSDGSTQDLTSSATWSSSKPQTASVTSPGGLATGVDNGGTTIKAAFGAFSAATTLTVNAVRLQSITVTPASVTIPAFGQVQFHATGYYNNGSTQDLTDVASWSLAPKWVATINSTGLATGGGPAAGLSFPGGTATVNAKWQGVVGSATLTVNP